MNGDRTVNRAGRASPGPAGATGAPPAPSAASATEPDGSDESEEPDTAAVAAELEDDIARLTGERDDLRALAQRLQAEFENYKKRVMRDQAQQVDHGIGALVEQLLPALDAFDNAEAMLAGADETVRKGMDLVQAQLVTVLGRAGLERIDESGAPFDPNVHEAVMQDDGPGAPVVGDVLRPGFAFRGRVLRPAMVRVAHPEGPGAADRG